jgi:hypothetical protein
MERQATPNITLPNSKTSEDPTIYISEDGQQYSTVDRNCTGNKKTCYLSQYANFTPF